jgi:hypothetical protein
MHWCGLGIAAVVPADVAEGKAEIILKFSIFAKVFNLYFYSQRGFYHFVAQCKLSFDTYQLFKQPLLFSIFTVPAYVRVLPLQNNGGLYLWTAIMASDYNSSSF